MKLILSIIAVLLIPLNVWMCELFYPNDVWNWWRLRMDIYSLIFCLLFIIANMRISDKLKKYFDFTIYVGVGLATSDVFDRWFSDVRQYIWSDVIVVLITLIIAYRKYLWNRLKRK